MSDGQIYKYLLTIVYNPFFKGLLVVGILSMAMSTADSHLNIAAVNLANDTWRKDNLSAIQKFNYARKYVILLCICAVVLVFVQQDFLKMVLFANSFYMPLITVPLLALVLGYKTTERTLLTTMGITAFILIIWHILKYFSVTTFEPVTPMTFFNAILLVFMHYSIEKWEWFKPFGITSQLKENKNG